MKITAKDYHKATEYDRFDMSGHFLDWPNQPDVFKRYPGKETLSLPRLKDMAERSFRGLYREIEKPRNLETLDIRRLSRIFLLGDTLTGRGRPGGEDFYFRSAASAGALYPNEIYLGAYDVENLDHGIYHYAIDRNSLTLLRKGDVAHSVASAHNLSKGSDLAATFFITAIFFRSAWKYRARAFRYVLLDAGHILENLVLALLACRVTFSIHYDFNDQALGHLMGIDSKREGCLACVHVMGKERAPALSPDMLDPLPDEILNASRVSRRETTYGNIENAYESGMSWDASATHAPGIISSLGFVPDTWISVPDVAPGKEDVPYPRAVFLRRSKRNFIRKPISREMLMGFLDVLCLSSRVDCLADHRASACLSIGFLTRDAADFTDGFYVLDAEKRRVGLVSTVPKIERMTRICLDQDWLRNSCIHFLFMTHLHRIDDTGGMRGYRYAMMHAGRLGQSLYLCATAMKLGCCGIGAFYDGEARLLLNLNEASALLYLVAVGPVTR